MTAEGDDMPEHTFADLLAGVIDLAPGGAPPHDAGPCADLCVPACAHSLAAPADPRPAARSEALVGSAAG